MKAIIELNYYDGPTAFIAYTPNKDIKGLNDLYYAHVSGGEGFWDEDRLYDFWSLPPRATDPETTPGLEGMAKPEFSMRESEIDWSEYK